MKPPCMAVVAHILPSLRVAIAQQLMKEYGLKSIEAASKMDITPAAITQYLKGTRGKNCVVGFLDNEYVKDTILKLASKLADDSLNQGEILESICSICNTIRKEGLLCELCKESSSTKLQGCNFCMR